MALPDLSDDSRLRGALTSFSDGHLSYLLGAGVSASSNLPTWSALLTSLLGRRKFDSEAIDALMLGQDTLLAAEAAFTPGTTKKRRQAAIYEALYGTKDTDTAQRDLSPGPLHLAVASDAIRRGVDHTTLLTLNYDDLLEEALTYIQIDGDEEMTTAAKAGVFARAAATPRKKNHYEVHHLHGLLARENLQAIGDDLILTLRDYNRVIDQSASWQQSEFEQALQHGPLLMVGTSYSDPDVRMWLHRVAETSPEKKYLLLPRQSIQLTPKLVDTLAPVIVHQWDTVNVECLLVDDYAETTQAIREMAHLNEIDYRPPRERVADVLQARLDDFTNAQETDYTTLAEQAEQHLYEIIGRPGNLTLWLLNHDTELVRWAANDRVYRDPISLRAVDPRLESSWIVSQALCYGDQHFQDVSVESITRMRTERTGRWRSVFAKPLTVELPGGPPVTVGALSSASEQPINDIDTDAWNEAMGDLAQAWEATLSANSPH